MLVWLETGLVAAGAFLTFLYGLGVRQRHKKALEQVSLERTKLENEADRVEQTLAWREAKVRDLGDQISKLDTEVSELEAKRDALKAEKAQLEAYLSEKDNHKSIERAKVRLAELEQTLSFKARLVDGYAIASVTTPKGDPCPPAYQLLIAEAAHVWSVAPGLKLKIRNSNNYIEWSGSTMDSLRLCVEVTKKTHVFNGNSSKMHLEVSQ